MTRPNSDEKLDEIHQRARRIETQLHRLSDHIGMSPKGEAPIWRGMQTPVGTVFGIDIPTPSVSIKDLLAVIPESIIAGPPVPVGVWHDGSRLMTIYPGRTPTPKEQTNG